MEHKDDLKHGRIVTYRCGGRLLRIPERDTGDAIAGFMALFVGVYVSVRRRDGLRKANVELVAGNVADRRAEFVRS